jgi:beta-lactamase superfamily II metal-dependent hydrolase
MATQRQQRQPGFTSELKSIKSWRTLAVLIPHTLRMPGHRRPVHLCCDLRAFYCGFMSASLNPQEHPIQRKLFDIGQKDRFLQQESSKHIYRITANRKWSTYSSTMQNVVISSAFEKPV